MSTTAGIIRAWSERLMRPATRQTIPTVADLVKAHRRRAPLRFYEDCLRSRPRLTQAATGGVLGAMGNGIAQYLEFHRAKKASGENEEENKNRSFQEVLDVRRLLAFSAFSAFWAGAPLVTYIRFIESKRMASVSLAGKLAFTHGVYNPFFYLPGFYIGYGALMGQTQEQVADRFWNLPKDMRTCVAFWFPVNALQFLFVPARAQVLFLSCANVVWSILLSLSSPAADSISVDPSDAGRDVSA